MSAGLIILPNKNMVAVNVPTSGTWTVPVGVETVYLRGWGGGGGGQVGIYNPGTSLQVGAGGGGAPLFSAFISVNPGDIISITIGAGGGPSANGGNTIWNDPTYGVLTMYGARSGSGDGYETASANGAGGGSGASNSGFGTLNGLDGQRTSIYLGGAGGLNNGSGGGAGHGGAGGDGGINVSSTPGATAAANSGAGGGGGAAGANLLARNAGGGGSGRIVIWYAKPL